MHLVCLFVWLCYVKGLAIRLDNPCKGVITVDYIIISPSLCANFECWCVAVFFHPVCDLAQ